jgi:predicted ATP-dependent endonuclease of OLD family
MKPISFRIANFKSIKDSGVCYLSDSITILAGKNEAGKTAILEALEDFNTEIEIRKEAIPISAPDALPEITMKFQVDDIDLEYLISELKIEQNGQTGLEIEIAKKYPSQYEFTEFTRDQLHIPIVARRQELEMARANLEKSLEKKGMDIPRELRASDVESLQSFVDSVWNRVLIMLESIVSEDEKSAILEHYESLESDLGQLSDLIKKETGIIEAVLLIIPNFVLFSSFDDIFPDKVPLAQLETNEWIKDLSLASNLDVKKILADDAREKTKHKYELNVVLNQDYKKFWTQEDLTLNIDWDSQNLFFWIKEEDQFYEPGQRSKGQQWHLAFYIRVTARSKEDSTNIILIDEPGLYLHAKAQEEVLQKLRDCATSAIIIFSTHSPFLLEPADFDKIRLIQKTEHAGTKIANQIHAQADKETLTPILTAIGLELNCGITNIDRANNVVVEGASDLYYLQAFKELLEDNTLNFHFGGGAGNMGFVGTILQGWGCKVIYLYDDDQGMKDGKKNLTRHWLVPQHLIESVIDAKGRIEDIFSPQDFRSYITEDFPRGFDKSNSDYIRQKALNKVILAREFRQRVLKQSVDLTATTIDKIQRLFRKLKGVFDHYD